MNFRHLNDLSISADFSDCGKFRYNLIIERLDGLGEDTVCVIMQNPSTANEYMADKSVQFLEKLIFKESYPEFRQVGRIVIVNQFAYIQTHNFEGLPEHIGTKNDRIIKEAIEGADIVLLAWGKNNCYEFRKEKIYSMLEACDGKILLETKKHPSRGYYKDFVTRVLETN